MKWEFENSGDITENPWKNGLWAKYTCQAPLNENRNEKSFRNKLTYPIRKLERSSLNQNSSTQTELAKQKKLFEENMADDIQSAKVETNRSKGKGWNWKR